MRYSKSILIVMMFNVFLVNCAFTESSNNFSCCSNAELHQVRSQELQKLLAEDQEDRVDLSKWSKKDPEKNIKKDLAQRKRVVPGLW